MDLDCLDLDTIWNVTLSKSGYGLPGLGYENAGVLPALLSTSVLVYTAPPPPPPPFPLSESNSGVIQLLKHYCPVYVKNYLAKTYIIYIVIESPPSNPSIAPVGWLIKFDIVVVLVQQPLAKERIARVCLTWLTVAILPPPLQKYNMISDRGFFPHKAALN